jgi:hypothetical protein
LLICLIYLQSVMDQADTYMNMAMATMWFTWATRGVYAGQRRVHLSIQPDDWYVKVNGRAWMKSGVLGFGLLLPHGIDSSFSMVC